jgi:hypothetical protein
MYFVVRKLGYLCAVFNQSNAEFAIKILGSKVNIIHYASAGLAGRSE